MMSPNSVSAAAAAAAPPLSSASSGTISIRQSNPVGVASSGAKWGARPYLGTPWGCP